MPPVFYGLAQRFGADSLVVMLVGDGCVALTLLSLLFIHLKDTSTGSKNARFMMNSPSVRRDNREGGAPGSF
jgi:hypothetical protein